jgi:RNA polymerase sigma factor for flagellar operon FliA
MGSGIGLLGAAGQEPDETDLFGRHWLTVEQAIRGVCRRQRFMADDAEDFTSLVCVRLLEDDCAVIRRFAGRSSLATYLTAVITHLAQDWRNTRWGKWRPSAAARQRGPVAVHLDRLLQRDGLSLDEACEILRTNYQVAESRSQLEEIAAALPIRTRRRFVEWGGLDHDEAWLACTGSFRDPYADDHAQRLARGLTAALRALSAEDRLLVKLRFEDGLRIVEIARRLHQPEKPLYRRIERLLGQLRDELEAHGLDEDLLQELLDQDPPALADGALRAAFARADSWALPADSPN